MLDIGWSELLVIGVVALVVVGPKELPTLLRTVGQWVGKARRMASEFQGQLNEAIREADLEDVRKSVDDLRSMSPTRLVTDQLNSIGDEIRGIGTSTEAEMAKIEAGVSADSEPAAFTEAGETAAISAAEVEGLIDAAATPAPDLEPPVFDLTPAPMPTAAIPDTPAVEAEAPVPATGATDEKAKQA